MRKIMALLSVFVLLGAVMAIQPVSSWTAGAQSKYSPTPAGGFTTEGGNVTEVNLSSSVSTEKWAGVYGNITGTIVLAPNAASTFYSWTWTPTNGGVVCASESATVDWGDIVPKTASSIDSDMGFTTSDTDSATNTFTDSSCNIRIAGSSYTTTGVYVNGGSFQTCALSGDVQYPNDYYYCVNITNGGTVFSGTTVTADYALMLPTPEQENQYKTYYFWLELH